MVHFPSAWVSKPRLISRDEYTACKSIAGSCCALAFFTFVEAAKKLRANAGLKYELSQQKSSQLHSGHKQFWATLSVQSKQTRAPQLLKAQAICVFRGNKIKTKHFALNLTSETFKKDNWIAGEGISSYLHGRENQG